MRGHAGSMVATVVRVSRLPVQLRRVAAATSYAQAVEAAGSEHALRKVLWEHYPDIARLAALTYRRAWRRFLTRWPSLSHEAVGDAAKRVALPWVLRTSAVCAQAHPEWRLLRARGWSALL